MKQQSQRLPSPQCRFGCYELGSGSYRPRNRIKSDSWFDKSKVNEVLEIENRFRPELLITVGYTDEKLEPSYRLPVDEIIEKR